MDEIKSIFMKVVKDNYANFDGRARRREFWMFNLVIIVAAIIISIVAAILGAISDILGGIVFGLFGLAMLAIIVPSIAVTVRRLHDIGKSGWYYFVSLVPFVGSFILLYFLIQEGNAGDNEFGPDPKAEA